MVCWKRWPEILFCENFIQWYSETFLTGFLFWESYQLGQFGDKIPIAWYRGISAPNDKFILFWMTAFNDLMKLSSLYQGISIFVKAILIFLLLFKPEFHHFMFTLWLDECTYIAGWYVFFPQLLMYTCMYVLLVYLFLIHSVILPLINIILYFNVNWNMI